MRPRRLLTVVLTTGAALSLAGPVAAVQDPARGSIELEVVDDRTGAPVGAVRVTGSSAAGPAEPRELEKGLWLIRGPAGARLDISVGAFGYRSDAFSITLAAEGRRREVRLAPDPLSLPAVRATARRSPSIGTRLVVERAELSLAGDDLGDVLRALPGVDVRGRGPGGPSAASIRGSRPEAVEVTLDGIPLTDPLSGIADLSMVPGSSLERIVTTQGPGAAGWGGGAGSIRLESRQASQGVGGRLGVGSFGRVMAEVETGASPGGTRIDAFGRFDAARNDFPFRNRIRPGTPDERRANADFAGWGALARVSTAKVPLRFLGRVDGIERGAPGRMGTAVWDLARWRESRASLGVAYGTDERNGAPRLSIGWSRNRQTYTDERVGRRESVAGDQLVATGRELLTPGVGLEWRAGWSRLTGDVVGDEARRIVAGVSLRKALDAGDGWSFVGGVSLDGSDVGFAVSPSLTVRRQVSSSTSMWVRAGQGYRLPTLGDLYLRPGLGASPNPDLAPERVRLDAELGVSMDPAGGEWRLELATFYRDTRDPIIWLPSVISVWSPLNAGRLRALGLQGAAALVPAPGWTIRMVGTVQDSRLGFEDYTDPLPYQPAWSGSASAERRGPGPDVRADVEIRGPRRTSIFGPHELPPFALLDIRVRQPFTAAGLGAVLEVGVSNVLDVAYERVELFPEPGRSLEVRLELGPAASPSLQGAAADRSFRPEAAAGEADRSSATRLPMDP
ncbi:MAG: TonB-dependent receptor [Gemmatimonadota bacterium]|nr:TonB-dependent receptor [Gemmatimonadota bacterium]